jgi:hypothetical protein
MSSNSKVNISQQMDLVQRAIHRDKKVGYDSDKHEFAILGKSQENVMELKIETLSDKIEDFIQNQGLGRQEFIRIEKEVDKETQNIEKEKRSFRLFKGKDFDKVVDYQSGLINTVKNTIRENRKLGFADVKSHVKELLKSTSETDQTKLAEMKERVEIRMDKLIEGFLPDNRLGVNSEDEFVIFSRENTFGDLKSRYISPKSDTAHSQNASDSSQMLEIQALCNEVSYFLDANEDLLTAAELKELNTSIEVRIRLLEAQKGKFYLRNRDAAERAIASLKSLQADIKLICARKGEPSAEAEMKVRMKNMVRGLSSNHRIEYNKERDRFTIYRRYDRTGLGKSERAPTMNEDTAKAIIAKARYAKAYFPEDSKKLLDEIHENVIGKIKHLNNLIAQSRTSSRKKHLGDLLGIFVNLRTQIGIIVHTTAKVNKNILCKQQAAKAIESDKTDSQVGDVDIDSDTESVTSSDESEETSELDSQDEDVDSASDTESDISSEDVEENVEIDAITQIVSKAVPKQMDEILLGLSDSNRLRFTTEKGFEACQRTSDGSKTQFGKPNMTDTLVKQILSFIDVNQTVQPQLNALQKKISEKIARIDQKRASSWNVLDKMVWGNTRKEFVKLQKGITTRLGRLDGESTYFGVPDAGTSPPDESVSSIKVSGPESDLVIEEVSEIKPQAKSANPQRQMKELIRAFSNEANSSGRLNRLLWSPEEGFQATRPEPAPLFKSSGITPKMTQELAGKVIEFVKENYNDIQSEDLDQLKRNIQERIKYIDNRIKKTLIPGEKTELKATHECFVRMYFTLDSNSIKPKQVAFEHNLNVKFEQGNFIIENYDKPQQVVINKELLANLMNNFELFKNAALNYANSSDLSNNQFISFRMYLNELENLLASIPNDEGMKAMREGIIEILENILPSEFPRVQRVAKQEVDTTNSPNIREGHVLKLKTAVQMKFNGSEFEIKSYNDPKLISIDKPFLKEIKVNFQAFTQAALRYIKQNLTREQRSKFNSYLNYIKILFSRHFETLFPELLEESKSVKELMEFAKPYLNEFQLIENKSRELEKAETMEHLKKKVYKFNQASRYI